LLGDLVGHEMPRTAALSPSGKSSSFSHLSIARTLAVLGKEEAQRFSCFLVRGGFAGQRRLS